MPMVGLRLPAGVEAWRAASGKRRGRWKESRAEGETTWRPPTHPPDHIQPVEIVDGGSFSERDCDRAHKIAFQDVSGAKALEVPSQLFVGRAAIRLHASRHLGGQRRHRV